MEDQLIDGSRGKLQKRRRTRTIKLAMAVILEPGQFILASVSKKWEMPVLSFPLMGFMNTYLVKTNFAPPIWIKPILLLT